VRIRACGLVFRDGKVLLQRKVQDAVWALPGGRVEAGETPQAALAREFIEELGWKVTVGPLRWALENCFTHEGVEVRQDELYFAVQCDSPLAGPREAALEFRWASPDEVAELDVRPVEIRSRLLER
jgi:8-oxo-dGTP pyrophosphatase MutT (NUDIX family)